MARFTPRRSNLAPVDLAIFQESRIAISEVISLVLEPWDVGCHLRYPSERLRGRSEGV